ncbi:hypothetical protein AUEXF2481DRAFT_27207 [Aureobasidium subglaciale EXF-2481]|uniref:NACHT-NTPase and P-loop NTPases N-terminal domain-containing protein n=1 Tax=Aureobasidium subglaciale (strain EXF-2481) TaxID=1043005 RepID=A0A074YJ66_AURSE|nr:uncharacterized protein AUEXF2481DRAFT_27207 [Aureobasidium subglaciale EXF-2481]KEQ97858.1 hypothetical protein AUEXF2481DRAFT_27207 [Aureobasidium subglaciale EXF-2481]
MAEVFGVVSGAVGVARFAFQIADGIRKLGDFCQAVKDTTIDLRDPISELIDLAELYKEIERSKRNLKDLQTLLSDVEAEARKRQTIGSVKAVLKKETFAKVQKRVERFKDAPQLSYMVYYKRVTYTFIRLS